jgi:hypothetical protein
MGVGNVTPTRDELLDELANEMTEPDIPDGAITVRMLTEKTGRIEKYCRTVLDNKVKQGKMGFVLARNTKWYYQIR